jgi:hypothetical protein
VCAALKKYGVILADLGLSWFLTGEAAPAAAWAAAIPDVPAFMADMKLIKGSYMEVGRARKGRARRAGRGRAPARGAAAAPG